MIKTKNTPIRKGRKINKLELPQQKESIAFFSAYTKSQVFN